MQIISNKEFQCYETIGESWNKGKQITLDGEALISVAALQDIRNYTDHLQNIGTGKKKSLEFLEKFIDAKITEYGR